MSSIYLSCYVDVKVRNWVEDELTKVVGWATTASQQLPLACLQARCCLVAWLLLGRASCRHQLMCRRQHRLGSRSVQDT